MIFKKVMICTTVVLLTLHLFRNAKNLQITVIFFLYFFYVFQHCILDKGSENFKNDYPRDLAGQFFSCQIFIEDFVHVKKKI